MATVNCIPGKQELAFSEKILELEIKLQETVVHVKRNSIRMFSEEINRLTTIYLNHFDKLSENFEV